MVFGTQRRGGAKSRGDERGMVNDYWKFEISKNDGQEEAESAGDVLDSVVRFVRVSPNSRKLNSHGPR